MYVSLPPDPLEIGVLRGRGLSRRRVKALVRIGQVWTDGNGIAWRVRQIHYKDGVVELACMAGTTVVGKFPSFRELGRHYHPQERTS